MEDVFRLDAELQFIMNTTGENFTYVVPETLQETVGYETIEISNTPPGKTNPD